MTEREKIVAEATEKAEKAAKKQNLNEAQAKLFIDEEVKKALEEFDSNQEENKIPVVQTSVPTTEKKAEKVQKSTENKPKNTEKKYIVHTPVKNYCGEVAGVQFAYGKAKVKPGWILNWFREHGYTVEEVSE